MSIRAADLAQDPTWTADVVIIGSGASGAVWADRLAAQGKDVLVLEEGGHYTGADFNQREEDMYPLLYRDGANQLTRDQRVSVLQGRCVGGSTVVNMADVERIPPEVLAHWRGVTGIDDFSEATFRPYFERSERDIGANRIADTDLNRNNQLLKQGTEALGHAGGPMVHNRVGCVRSGYCLLGCTYDAKRSMLVTLIPRAEQANARVVSGARVTRLKREGGRIRYVHGDRIDPRTGRIAGAFRVRADTVVLAAGAIHTPLILLASGITEGPVGRHLSLQPQLPISALFDEEIRPFRGIPQAYYHNEFERHSEEDGLGGFRLEGISGGPAMSAMNIGLYGEDHKAYIAQYARTAALLLLVPDRPGGHVRRRSNGRPDIRYGLQKGWKRAARHGVQTAVDAYFAAGAREVFLPAFPARIVRERTTAARMVEALDFAVGNTRTISAHPQGTCRIGTDPRTSVANPDGRHHHVANLYVIDASLFPTTASTHTMLPIMATADWLAHRFLSRS